jgi:endoglucanase
MLKKESLKIGVNLGGWISQYKQFDPRHFDTFITKEDIGRIANWGFDHIRLPIDYEIMEDGSGPGTYPESGFKYLDRCLNWCQDNRIRLIFDIHRAPGYSFTNTLEADMSEENTLFSKPSCQQRFLHLWETLTRRYSHKAEDILAFELLNEIVLPDSLPWQKLGQQIINHIRGIDSERLIIIGGNNYNAVDELMNIRMDPDPNLLYSFHFYEPMVVTHQKAYWVVEMEEFNQPAHYPGEVPGLSQFIKTKHPVHTSRYENSFGRRLDRQYLSDRMRPARHFMRSRKESVYCGEFGVIDRAPIQTRINWTRDLIDVFNGLHIGYAYWSYKQMDFGLVDSKGNPVSDELLRVVTQDYSRKT